MIERSPWQLLEFLYLLARMELKARYKGRFLGYLGAVGLIFALAFVFWIAFKVIMGLDLPNYSVYLVAGLFPWAWMSMGVVSASRSFVANAGLIKEMGIAHAILPLSNVVQEMMHFALALPLIVAWVAIPGDYPPTWSWLWQIPLLMALQLVFVYPLALAAAQAPAGHGPAAARLDRGPRARAPQPRMARLRGEYLLLRDGAPREAGVHRAVRRRHPAGAAARTARRTRAPA